MCFGLQLLVEIKMLYNRGRQSFLSSVPICKIQCQNTRLRADKNCVI